MQCRFICTPRSSNVATLEADAIRRAALRTRSSGTPHASQYFAIGSSAKWGSTSPSPSACRASHSLARRFSCTRTPSIAARSQASVPGLTCRWISASSALSLRRGSTTMRQRAGSLAISFSVTRACGKLWDIQGFLPRKNATSQCSKSLLV